MKTNNTILVIDDSLDDFKFIKLAFQKSFFSGEIEHCISGDAALDKLGALKTTEENNSKLPTVIFLDLNMPGINGHEVLLKIKQDEKLNSIPVYILTTSDDQNDMDKCMGSGANGYFIKPLEIDGFIKIINGLKECNDSQL